MYKSKESTARIAIVARYFVPAFLAGGPIRTLSAMVAQAAYRSDVAILTSNRDLGTRERLPVVADRWIPYAGASIRYMSDHRALRYLTGLCSLRRLQPTLLYLNSFFDWRYSILPNLLAQLRLWGRVRVVIAPRGEFSHGALALSARKKSWFMKIALLCHLYDRVAWHASTEAEAEDIRAFAGRSCVVLVHADETGLPSEPLPIPASHTSAARIAFLSRISPKKGLHVLLEALTFVTAQISLDIYGEAEDKSYLARCRELASWAPPNVSINWCGAVPPQNVVEVFNQYDGFFFPTAGENFGHVIPEALAGSCPVWLCDVTPWSTHARRTGGIVDDHSPSSWARALEALAMESNEARKERRLHAQRVYRLWAAESATSSSFLDVLRLQEAGLASSRQKPQGHRRGRAMLISEDR